MQHRYPVNVSQSELKRSAPDAVALDCGGALNDNACPGETKSTSRSADPVATTIIIITKVIC